MSRLAVSENIVAVARGLYIDCYEQSQHHVYTISLRTKEYEGNNIVDIVISSDNKYLALITSLSKELLLFELPLLAAPKSFALPRSASKIRFTVDNMHILIADKSGDALIFEIEDEENKGNKLLGHLSLLLDILQTRDGKFIITSDRDEKVKVSCYPNTYNINTYCLGHKEFVNHIEILPHDSQYLLTASGDGTIKLWNYLDGKLVHSIDTSIEIDDDKLSNDFVKTMDDDGIQVSTLPIVHFAAAKQNQHSSFLAVTVHTVNKVFIYILLSGDNNFSHKLVQALPMTSFPTAVCLHDFSLYIYNDAESIVQMYKLSKDKFQPATEICMFKEKMHNAEQNNNSQDSIKVLYKRKFDNVKEYQERKKQRLGKSK